MKNILLAIVVIVLSPTLAKAAPWVRLDSLAIAYIDSCKVNGINLSSKSECQVIYDLVKMWHNFDLRKSVVNNGKRLSAHSKDLADDPIFLDDALLNTMLLAQFPGSDSRRFAGKRSGEMCFWKDSKNVGHVTVCMGKEKHLIYTTEGLKIANVDADWTLQRAVIVRNEFVL